MDETTNENIRFVYENLLRGSRNHLRTFTRILAQNGQIYKPTLLSDDYYNEIIAGEIERGSGSGNCSLGYGYANRNRRGNRYGYQSSACDSLPSSNVNRQQKRYGQQRWGN